MVLFLQSILQEDQIPKIIYNSFNDTLLSSSIPLNYYKRFSDLSLSNFKIKDIDIFSLIKDNSIFDKRALSVEHHYIDIISKNFYFCIQMLTNDIICGFNSELDNINNSINKCTTDINFLLYQKSNISEIDTVSTKYMRNKSKKRFKKEKKEIKSKGISSQLSNLSDEVSSLEAQKAILEEKYKIIEDALKTFTVNSKDFTISELYKLHKKYFNNKGLKDFYKLMSNNKSQDN